MNLSEELIRFNTLFIDTAPVIYFIEALAKKFAELLKHGRNLTLLPQLSKLEQMNSSPMTKSSKR